MPFISISDSSKEFTRSVIELKYEILWQQMRIHCIMFRRGYEETIAFGELALWIKGLFVAVSGWGLLFAF